MAHRSFSVSRRRALAGVGLGGVAALVAAPPAAAAPAPPAPGGGPTQPPPGFGPQNVPPGVNPIASPPRAGFTYAFRTMWDFTPESFSSGRVWTSAGGVYAPTGSGDTLWATCDLPSGAILGDVEWYLSATEHADLMGRLWVSGVSTLMEKVADGEVAASVAGVRAVRIVPPAGSNGPYPHGTALALGVFTPSSAAVAVNGVRVGYRLAPTGQVLLPTPQRVYDSRSGARIASGQTRTHSLAGRLPAGATGAIFNVTVTSPDSSGYLTVYSADSARPATSSINWDHTGQTIANTALASVSASRAVKVSCGGHATHYLLDLVGYLA